MNKILLSNLDFPEGPAVGKNGEIWFVELHGGNVCRHIPGSDTRCFHIEGGKPNGIAVDSKGEIWFCDAGNDCVSVLLPSNGEVHTVCADIGGEKLAHPNDLAFDSLGNLLFTCPGESRTSPTGYVCALSKKGVKKIIDGKFFPNGLAFTPDGKSLVIAETYKKGSGKAIGIPKLSNGQTRRFLQKPVAILAPTEWLLGTMEICTLQFLAEVR